MLLVICVFNSYQQENKQAQKLARTHGKELCYPGENSTFVQPLWKSVWRGLKHEAQPTVCDPVLLKGIYAYAPKRDLLFYLLR